MNPVFADKRNGNFFYSGGFSRKGLYRSVPGISDPAAAWKIHDELRAWDSLLKGIKVDRALLLQKTSPALDAIRSSEIS